MLFVVNVAEAGESEVLGFIPAGGYPSSLATVLSGGHMWDLAARKGLI